MLLKLSDKISECLAHAAEARERAKAATDADHKADFHDMELRWLRLVESYRFVEQASRFLEDGHLARIRNAKKWRRRVCWSSHVRPRAKIFQRAF